MSCEICLVPLVVTSGFFWRLIAGALLLLEDNCDTEDSEILLVVLDGDDADDKDEEDRAGGDGGDRGMERRDGSSMEGTLQHDPSSSSSCFGGAAASPYNSPSKSNRQRRQQRQQRRRRAWETNHPVVVVTSASSIAPVADDHGSKGELEASECDYTNDSFEEDDDNGEGKLSGDESQMS